jgi:nucleoside 2-deoxyribosyltransferase
MVIIGDIVVDVTLKTSVEPYKLRLGGITHAARGAWSMGETYSIGFFAPSYLDSNIADYFAKHGCDKQTKLGEIQGAPYVFLIAEAKETGVQGYEFLLREHIDIKPTEDLITTTSETDVLLISGNYDMKSVLVKLSSKNLHIDLANNVASLGTLRDLDKVFSTIFISTSTTLFSSNFKSDFKQFAELFRPYCLRLVLKENRGGSRGIDFTTNNIVEIPSQTQPIVHSVGVGDVFDTSYVARHHNLSFREALTVSSWIASEYALTTFPDDFKTAVERLQNVNVDDLVGLSGVFVPWEKRVGINIYIAAPDFDFMDTKEIDRLVDSLKYHNFSPRRPIKENGQMEANANDARRKELFDKDINLINECKILVAVLLNNDPGTLVEIGFAKGLGLPVIVYDPFDLSNNCMLSELPTLVSSSLDEVISEVFKQASKILNE